MRHRVSHGRWPDDPCIKCAQRGVKHLVGAPMGGRVVSTLQLVLGAVGEGRIRGGWEYVWAAYGIAWTGLGLYALSLWVRLRREDRR
jgi:hypothetical protein